MLLYNLKTIEFLNILISDSNLILNSSPILMAEIVILFDFFVRHQPVDNQINPNTNKNENITNIKF